MRHMKLKAIRGAILSLSFLLLSTSSVLAETENNIEDLTPNVFEEEKIKLDPGSLGERGKQVDEISEEILVIPFEKTKKTADDMKQHLFLDSSSQNNTIAAQVEKYDLFTATETTSILNEESNQAESQPFLSLQWIYIIVISIGVIILFTLLIPRLNHQQANRK
ncbi:type VII secretion protein EssA [Priestia megaterium]|nr:type VII secretion protein EssA [Priestia megaterium]